MTTESEDRIRSFDSVIREFQAVADLADSITAPIYAPDTNFFLHNQQPFYEVDWLTLDGETQAAATVLVSSVVVRELDRHKRSGKNITVSETNTQPLRTRARMTLRTLRNLFLGNDPTIPVDLRTGVRIELIQQPVRQPSTGDADSDVIDHLTTVQSLLVKPVWLATNDRSMEFAARAEGLRTVSIPEPEGGN